MAYDNNINPGNPPLVWSRIRDAFDKINENFTVIGATLRNEAPYNIETIELTNPVQVTTFTDHQFENGKRATIAQTEISQLDGNTYYVKVIRPDTVQLYSNEALTTPVDGTAYDSWVSPQAGTIQGLSEYASLDFENLTTNVSPARTDTYNLGSTTNAWQQLYLSEFDQDVPGAEINGIWFGTAQIKGYNGIVDLPLNSTVNGELIINPNNTFFKSVQIDNGDRIVADEFIDTLNLLSGNGLSMSADSGAESITLTNTGVLSNIAGNGISVSSATGNITISNTGVRSLQNITALPTGRTEGAGININASTGDNLKITNTGVLEIQAGSAALTVFTDDATGIVTITNASPAGNAFRFVDVDGGATTMEANSVAGTLNLVSGNGIALTGDAGSDTVTVAFSGVADITGSVFSDDSTKMVDAVENEMYASGGFFGNLTGNVTGNITGNVTGNVTGNLVGNSTGYHTGDVKGSVFGDDSTKIVDAVENKVYADFFGNLTGNVTGDTTGTHNGAVVGNVTGNLTGNVTGNLTGYHTGDMTGSVFADNSTMLVDGTNGVLRGTHIGDVIGSVFADNSTMLVNGVDGTLYYDPGTPANWNGDAPTTVGEALDRIAAWIKASDGTGA